MTESSYSERTNTIYEELNMRQKSLVDAIALNDVEGRGLTNDEVLDLAHELHGEKRYSSPTMVSKYRKMYGHIIEERGLVLANSLDGDGGDEVTVGDPMRKYTGDPSGIDATMQDIQDRPVTETRDDEGADGDTYILPVGRDRMFQLIRSEDEELARWAFNILVGDDD